MPKCGEVRALPAPRSCVFASRSWPSSPTCQKLFSRNYGITKMRWPKDGVFGHFPKCGEVRALPAPRSCVFASRGWPAKPTRQKLYFRNSEIAELRKCVGPRKGSLAIFRNVAKLGPSPPHVAAFFQCVVGLQSRRTRINFPKFRNYGVTKMRWHKEGVVGHLPKCGEVRALPAPRSCVFMLSRWPS